jgi:NAD/NADP transhydrogenase beta subunit
MFIAYFICAATFIGTIIVYAEFTDKINAYFRKKHTQHLRSHLASTGKKHHYAVIIQELKNGQGYNVYIHNGTSEHVVYQESLSKACASVTDYIHCQ